MNRLFAIALVMNAIIAAILLAPAAFAMDGGSPAPASAAISAPSSAVIVTGPAVVSAAPDASVAALAPVSAPSLDAGLAPAPAVVSEALSAPAPSVPMLASQAQAASDALQAAVNASDRKLFGWLVAVSALSLLLITILQMFGEAFFKPNVIKAASVLLGGLSAFAMNMSTGATWGAAVAFLAGPGALVVHQFLRIVKPEAGKSPAVKAKMIIDRALARKAG